MTEPVAERASTWPETEALSTALPDFAKVSVPVLVHWKAASMPSRGLVSTR